MKSIIYSIDQIASRTFDSSKIPDLSALEKSRPTYRLSEGQIEQLPEDTVNQLRRRLSELFNTRFHGNYLLIESFCDIKRDTFQKALKFRNGRKISYTFLAKFCVGAKLSTEEAKELFFLMGYVLNPRNKADYILLCELENGCDIIEYNADVIKYCGKSVLSTAD